MPFATLVVLVGLLSPALTTDLKAVLDQKVYSRCMDMVCGDVALHVDKELQCFAKFGQKDVGYLEEQLMKKCYGKSPDETHHAVISKACKESEKYFSCYSEFVKSFMALERSAEEKAKYHDAVTCTTSLYEKCA